MNGQWPMNQFYKRVMLPNNESHDHEPIEKDGNEMVNNELFVRKDDGAMILNEL